MASSTAPWARTREPLLWLAGAGHEIRRTPDYCFDCLRRIDSPHIVLQLTLSGAGFYRRGRSQVLLRPGMAFLDAIPGPFHYGCAPNSGEPYELVYVSFHGAQADQWLKRIVRSFGHVLNIAPGGRTASLMTTLAARRRTTDDRYLASAEVYQLLMTLMSELSRRRVVDTLMDRALEGLAAGATNPHFSIGELASRMNCSREHFSRRFRAATGVGPRDYLIQHRLRLAAARLREGNDKLQSIALACGMRSGNYLCRVFHQRLGVTPAQFRAQPWLAGP